MGHGSSRMTDRYTVREGTRIRDRVSGLIVRGEGA